MQQAPTSPTSAIPPFDRRFLSSEFRLTRIGSGAIGGKGRGLYFIDQVIGSRFDDRRFPNVTVAIPYLAVLATDVFDRFIGQNRLAWASDPDIPDSKIAQEFQKAIFPPEYVGDLMALVSNIHVPLAIRSSSVLEDGLNAPFAGVYATKMIPNNQLEATARFERLVEAIKFVWASTFFENAKAYRSRLEQHHGPRPNEKMAVLIQEVVGRRYGDRFYPQVSGVAKSYNFYPTGSAPPETGVIQLALGLGKTIVDGGRTWTFSPAAPTARPPYNRLVDLLKSSQRDFWAINMRKPESYDPIKETEYLVHPGLAEAEDDGNLVQLASTYDHANDRLYSGTFHSGPRLVDFDPLLSLGEPPLIDIVKELLALCEHEMKAPVEIEFALTLGDAAHRETAQFGFLQVRPIAVPGDDQLADLNHIDGPALIKSDNTIGCGTILNVSDVVYVNPDTFSLQYTRQIAAEVSTVCRSLLREKRRFVLVGFGRWGSSDPWLGVPVAWSDISGVAAIVEAMLPDMAIDLSQGAHFFHNLVNLGVPYFCIPPDRAKNAIDWNLLAAQKPIHDMRHVRHIRFEKPLRIEVNGYQRKGRITQ